MAKFREVVCAHYVCAGAPCKKGREAEHYGYCQKCAKYVPRARMHLPNRKKAAVEKERGRFDY